MTIDADLRHRARSRPSGRHRRHAASPPARSSTSPPRRAARPPRRPEPAAVGQLDRRRPGGPHPLEQGPRRARATACRLPPLATTSTARPTITNRSAGRQGRLPARGAGVRHGLLLQRLRQGGGRLVAGPHGEGAAVRRRRPGPVKWAYSTGGTAVAPPTVGGEGVLAMSNDRALHALTRGSAGGVWPAGWVPGRVMGVAHSRSPVVPFMVPLAGPTRCCSPATTPGSSTRSTPHRLRPWPAPPEPRDDRGAWRDLHAVRRHRDRSSWERATATCDNALRALSSRTHACRPTLARHPRPDRADQRHARDRLRHDSASTSPRRAPAGRRHALLRPDQPTRPRPVFDVRVVAQPRQHHRQPGAAQRPGLRRHRRRLPSTPSTRRPAATTTLLAGDGPVKGFLFPDRRNDDLMFATDTKVWSISDTAPRHE